MKTKLIKSNDKFYASIPSDYVQRLNLKENDIIDIDLNLENTQIMIGKSDEQNIQDIEADEDF